MKFDNFFLKYRENFFDLIRDAEIEELEWLANKISEVGKGGGSVYIAGNGGSAAIASHFAVDLTKAVGINGRCFNESSLITCFANDYGYENWVMECCKSYVCRSDMVILVSSSGESKNMINALEFCASRDIPVFSLSGFHGSNTLRAKALHGIWIDAQHYNNVENAHQFLLLAVLDFLREGKT